MYVQDNSTAEPTVDGTPRKMVGPPAGGDATGMTADAENSQFVITKAGDYGINFGISFSGTANKTFIVAIYKNTTNTGFQLKRKMGAGGDVGVAVITGQVTCEVDDTLSLYQWSTDGGTSLTVTDGQLVVERLS
jgi:hypothetical protein